MNKQAANEQLAAAERVRKACVEAALVGYEDASISGLCGEGALEAAISAIERIDLKELLQAADPAATVQSRRSGT